MSQNTIGYFLNQLPDGIREKAIANVEAQIGKNYLDYSHPRINSVSIAVKGAFKWEITPEGEEFWVKVCRESPGYEPPRPVVHPLLAILGVFGMMAELLEELDEVTQESQEQSQTSTENLSKPEPTPAPIPEIKPQPKSVTAAVRQVLGELGIDISTKSVFSDGRKEGVSVKVCNLFLKEETKQKVREKMEALGYKYHRINEPSGNVSSSYYRGTFLGTRFHFS
jgi:hypothetical protein